MNIDILREAFGDREFTTAEAAWALGLKRAGGTLSRLKTQGLLLPAGPGRFRVAPPSSLPLLRARAAEERLRQLFAGPVPLALDGPDAVALWTEGRYRPPMAPGATVVHLACAPGNLEGAASVLDSLGVPWTSGGEWPKGRGLRAIVRTVPKLRPARRSGWPVISRKDVVRLIASDPAAYEGAKEWVVP
jgi:hypothetical protein